MRLWHKAWLESRVRFLLLVVMMVASAAGAVLLRGPLRAALATRDLRLDSYDWYVYRVVFGGFGRTLFMISAFMLGLGGLLRERDLGTAVFTLALPVGRLRLVVVRAVTALVELAVLALVPALVIPALSMGVHETYAWSQALEFALLWTAGGATILGVAFLLSSMLGGEYTGFVVSWIVLFGHTLTTQYVRITHPSTRPYLFTVQEVMSGLRMSYFDPKVHLLVGPVPWVPVMLLMSIAGALVASAALCNLLQDF